MWKISRSFRLGIALSFFTNLWGAAATAGLFDPNAYSSLGSLSISSGTVTFNTDTLTISGNVGSLLGTTGALQSQSGGPDVAVFDFTGLSLGSGVSIQVVGARPLAILSRADAVIDAAITLTGQAGSTGGAGTTGAARSTFSAAKFRRPAAPP